MVKLAFIIREIVLHGGDGEFLLESVDLVQEQDDRSLDEPSRVADGIKKSKSLLHPVDCFIFEEELIILRYGHEKEDSRNILKAMNPLLPLGSLTTNIKHAVGELADDECGLSDTSGLDSRP